MSSARRLGVRLLPDRCGAGPQRSSRSRIPGDERTRLLAMAAALGVAPERLMESQRPALAQARKLKLAQMRGTQLWAAVLDEPANHREVPASERLEEALAAYRGALLLVTPDEHLAQR